MKMSTFDVKAFALDFDSDPELGKIEKLRKSDLLELGKSLGYDLKQSMKKAEISSVILQHYVDENVLDPSVMESVKPESDSQNVAVMKLQLDHQLKMREMELKLKQCEIEQERLKLSQSRQKEFDVSRNIKLVPPFNESDVDKYFLHFEKVAVQCQWPKEHWAIMLQSVLTGKAQQVYAALSVEDSANFDKVKDAILKAFELVPETYRKLFRNCKKKDECTYIEFAQQKEMLFDRWCKSRNVNSIEKLRQLILVEEFKRCSKSEVHTYLDEKNVGTLAEAAKLADEYCATHIVNVKKRREYDHVASQKTEAEGENKDCKKRSDSDTFCYYCKKQGHFIGECPKLEKKQARQAKETALATTVTRTSNGQIPAGFKTFVTTGSVSLTPDGTSQPVKILRDTGALQSLLLEGTLPFEDAHQSEVLIRGIGGYVSVPLREIYLDCEHVKGKVCVGVMSDLPVQGVTLLLGNDLAGDRVCNPYPVMNCCSVMNNSCDKDSLEDSMPEVYSDCAVTRAMAKRLPDNNEDELLSGLADTFMSDITLKVDIQKAQAPATSSSPSVHVGRDQLIHEQHCDIELNSLFHKAVDTEEVKQKAVCYYVDSGVLMRKWRNRTHPADEWYEVHQIVTPRVFRKDILTLAHDSPMSGHLGVQKTLDRIQRHFFWPTINQDVSKYCKTCHTCQLVGKPNQKVPIAPLKPIPAMDEPFTRVIIDCVGPLPRTKAGNEYILTIMDAATRFPEAVPLRKITAPAVTKALVKFFTLVGLPKVIQSDQGSNFTSRIFNQIMKELGIQHTMSSAYHPQSQGALERYHQTLKNMMRCYCMDHEKDWDEGIPLLLFATREVTQESLGFSPFDLVYGHSVRGPLKLLKEQWLQDEITTDVLSHVSAFRERLQSARETARENLEKAQSEMKTWYDRNTVQREFQVGDKVLAMLPIPGSPLKARFYGPYVVSRRVGDLDYELLTPGRRKAKQLCHINMLKLYHEREDSVVNAVVNNVSTEKESCDFSSDIEYSVRIDNSHVLEKLESKLCHVDPEKKKELCELMSEFPMLFNDKLSQTDVVAHDVDVGDTKPIKQHPYRVSPVKREKLSEEVKFMLQNELIEPSNSDWSSPCILVPKSDGSYRFCTDYRKVNKVTKTDAYPIPRMDDCIDKIGQAKYVTKLDLMKGYWQVPLTKRGCEISGFVTPDGLYCYKVMPFGMKNSGATFQRLMNKVIFELDGVEVYIDDLVVYSNTWEHHIAQLRKVFQRLSESKLTVNLKKCEFVQAQVVYLGHVVGSGVVRPNDAKVHDIVNFAQPQSKRELMRFLGMAGYYRRFCKNFTEVVYPMNQLLAKGQKFVWTEACNTAFENVKAMLASKPVVLAPDFSKEFILQVDACDIGAGAVLLQSDSEGVLHPVCYFSKKFNDCQTRYSTVEKETLSLILAINHFEVYLCNACSPIKVFTDNNPLTFLAKMKNKNSRLTRWSLILQEYDLDIKHVKGTDNVIADTLSRCYVN